VYRKLDLHVRSKRSQNRHVNVETATQASLLAVLLRRVLFGRVVAEVTHSQFFTECLINWASYKLNTTYSLFKQSNALFLPVPMAVRSKARFFLGFWVHVTTGAWMSVCCECSMLWVRRLFDGPITRPEEFYRELCVWVCTEITTRRGTRLTRAVEP
jgi:hypothetical protein